jgi:hypothetical protein
MDEDKCRIVNKNSFLEVAFQSISDYLFKLEDCPNDWHLAPQSGTIPSFTGWFPSTRLILQLLGRMGASQYPSGSPLTVSQWGNWQVGSAVLMTLLQPYSVFHASRQNQDFHICASEKPFWNKYISLKMNLVTLMTLDTNVRKPLSPKVLRALGYCCPYLEYKIRGDTAVQHSLHTFNSAYHHLQLPF